VWELPVRQPGENFLRQPLGVVRFGEKALPDGILMGGLLAHPSCLLMQLSVNRPKPNDGNHDVEGEHHDSPKREIGFHVGTIAQL